MESEKTLFRSAMRGFNREDVTAYLEKTASEHRRETAALQEEIETLGSAKNLAETAVADLEKIRDRQAEKIDELTRKIAGEKEKQEALRQENGRLQQELESLRAAQREESERAKAAADETAALKAQVTVLAEVQRALSQKSEALAKAETELAALKEERAGLLEEAEAYRAVKERVAGIELEAHQRAQAAEDEAKARAEEIRRRVERWLDQAGREFHTLRTAIDGAAARTREELDRVRGTVDEICGRFADGEEAFGGFARDYRAATAPKAPEPLELDEES